VPGRDHADNGRARDGRVPQARPHAADEQQQGEVEGRDTHGVVAPRASVVWCQVGERAREVPGPLEDTVR